MRINILIHVPFETPGYISDWAEERNFQVKYTLLYKNEQLPELDSFDFLIIMGGPMGANDDDFFTWMKPEKKLIKSAIAVNKKVLGICLGAQLLACVLGAKVYPNNEKEIGWWPVRKVIPLKTKVFNSFPTEMIVLQWHGDTFDLPIGAELLATNETTKNQAFIYKDNVLALQFHPEMTPISLNLLTEEERTNFKTSKYVQSLSYILAEQKYFEQCRKFIYDLLDHF